MNNPQINSDQDIYLKINDAIIQLMWSSNPPYDPQSAGVIGIYIYDLDGEEYTGDLDIEGGELDVDNDSPLTEHISEVLDFIGASNMDYEFISEEEFDNIMYGDEISK